MVQRADLAAFLRSRRERADPIAHGLQPGPRRRTPGLRREEVAQLSGVSVTWYTWLEQARDISVSRQVVESLARALRLPEADRAHLFRLAGHLLPPPVADDRPVDDALRRVVEALAPAPAFVMTRWWDVIAANAPYLQLSGIDLQSEQAERNVLWRHFVLGEPAGPRAAREGEARALVGQLRLRLGRFPDDPHGPRLVDRLRQADPRFAQLWAEQAVARSKSARKLIDHPVIGRLALDHVKLEADDETSLVTLLPGDARTAAALRALAS